MEKSQPVSPSQSISQSQIQKYESCLLVTRHKLLQQQESDLNQICERIVRIETLPNDLNELKKLIDFYDAVVGIIPLPFQVQILQMKKNVILFNMESIGTAKTEEEARDLLAKSGRDGVILPPVKQGESYRVSVYKGIVMIKEIKVVDVPIIEH